MEKEQEFLGLTKKGSVRKRKPKKKNNYFTEDTDNAIIRYIATDSEKERNKIYNEEIHYALYKLAENIIHTFKFYYTEVDSIEDLKYEVISFVVEKLPLFHHSKNINDRLAKIIIKQYNEEYEIDSFIKFTNNSITVTQDQIDSFIASISVSQDCLSEISKITPPKAYSYFGTIVKRYLIIYNQKNYKKLVAKIDVNDIDNQNNTHEKLIHYTESNEINRSTVIDAFIKKVDSSITNIFDKEDDIKAANAILEIFKKRDNIDIFNKKALFIYVKEMADVQSNTITKVITKLKTIYRKILNEQIDFHDHDIYI